MTESLPAPVEGSPPTRTGAELQPLVHVAIGIVGRSGHFWQGQLTRVLRTRWIIAANLPGRMRGFTLPLAPVIWIDRRLAAVPMPVAESSELSLNPAQRDAVHTLIHEAAHQLWAIWPEWQLWFGRTDVYGPGRNAADAVAEAIVRTAGCGSRYPGQDISYVSPLCRLGVIRRRP